MNAESRENRIVLTLASVQFVNVLDFMLVMPLGPKFSESLGFPASKLPIVAGCYAIAAAVSGLGGAFVLDRFDRKKALLFCLSGLAFGTFAAAWACDLWQLMAARALAGAFGGPATSLCLAIIADVIPSARRGRALGKYMSGFAVASTLGVPIGLRLAEWGNAATPFYSTGALCVVAMLGAAYWLPSLRGHLGAERKPVLPALFQLMGRKDVLISYGMTACGSAGMFSIIPSISPYLQGNLHYPQERMDALYLAGGVTNFMCMPIIGRVVDRVGSFRTALWGVIASALVIGICFGQENAAAALTGSARTLFFFFCFIGFMVSSSVRNIPYSTLASKVPQASERAGFMSMQSVVQHMFFGLGSMLASGLLHDDAEHPGRLIGMPNLALATVVLLTLSVIGFMRPLEVLIRQRPQSIPPEARPAA